MLQSKTLYMLGAGASSQYVSQRPDIISRIKAHPCPLNLTLGLDRQKQTSDQENDICSFLSKKPSYYLDELENIIMRCPDALKIITLNHCDVSKDVNFCPEYDIFNLTNKESIFINFNHDNLLSESLPRRRNSIYNIHGTLNPDVSQYIHCIMENLQSISDSPERLEEINREYTILSEEKSTSYLTNMHDEIYMILNQNNFKHLAIIGYSFFRKNDYSLMDYKTYNLIEYAITSSKFSELIIFDPVNFLFDVIPMKYFNNYHAHPVRWNCLTYSLYLVRDYFIKNLILDTVYLGGLYLLEHLINNHRFVELFSYFYSHCESELLENQLYKPNMFPIEDKKYKSR